jgi:hypothetical protein
MCVLCQCLSENERLSLVHSEVDFPVFYQLQLAFNENKRSLLKYCNLL